MTCVLFLLSNKMQVASVLSSFNPGCYQQKQRSFLIYITFPCRYRVDQIVSCFVSLIIQLPTLDEVGHTGSCGINIPI